jgi:hypothetical protein
VGSGKKWGKGEGGWICCKYCVHMYVNGEMRPVETIPGMEWGRINKGEWWNMWIQVWYIGYIVRIFANSIMYPSIIKNFKHIKGWNKYSLNIYIDLSPTFHVLLSLTHCYVYLLF